jgi:hypothetical protein
MLTASTEPHANQIGHPYASLPYPKSRNLAVVVVHQRTSRESPAPTRAELVSLDDGILQRAPLAADEVATWAVMPAGRCFQSNAFAGLTKVAVTVRGARSDDSLWHSCEPSVDPLTVMAARGFPRGQLSRQCEAILVSVAATGGRN